MGREPELAELSVAWDRASAGEPQLAVLWGRRRVGKTWLLTHFAEGRRSIYFTAVRQDSDERQLRRFAQRVREDLGEEVADLAPDTFPTWEAALRFVARLAEERPLLVVLDEAPRLTSGTDFADTVSAVWENRVRDQRLMLVLSGSAVSVMERMLGPQGGLHRRAAVERRLDPFSLTAGRVFLPDLPPVDYIQAYAACGGYPLHLRRWDPDLIVDENMAAQAFAPGGLLLRDAPDILSEDLDWRGGYERVLAAMAGGARRRSRIAGRAQQRIDYTLDRLQRAGYVQQIRPVGSGASPDPLYEIGDPYLSFWFRVLRDDADLIEGGQGRAVMVRTRGMWATHVSRVFEAAARDHATRLVIAGEFPDATVVGRWWRDETLELDAVGFVGDEPVFVGEAKWQDRPPDARDIAALRRKGAALPAPNSPLRHLWWTRAKAPSGQLPDDVLSFDCADLLSQ